MKPEKIKALTLYQNLIKTKLASSVPPKHAHRPEAYKAYLTKELAYVSKQLKDATI